MWAVITPHLSYSVSLVLYPIEEHTRLDRGNYTHMHTHTHAHTYTHTHASTHTHTRMHKHINTNTCKHTYTHTYIHTHTHTQSHTCMRTHVHSHMHAYTHTTPHAHARTHTHTHTHMHMHTHTHTHILWCNNSACYQWTHHMVMAGTVLHIIDWPIEAVGVVVGAAIWERRGKELEVHYSIWQNTSTMGWGSKATEHVFESLFNSKKFPQSGFHTERGPGIPPSDIMWPTEKQAGRHILHLKHIEFRNAMYSLNLNVGENLHEALLHYWPEATTHYKGDLAVLGPLRSLGPTTYVVNPTYSLFVRNWPMATCYFQLCPSTRVPSRQPFSSACFYYKFLIWPKLLEQ